MDHHRTATSAADEGRRHLNAWRQHRPLNYFRCDPFFQGIVARHLADGAAAARPRLESLGELAAGVMDLLARECSRDHCLPRIERVDELGNPVEAVVFDPAYHQLGELFWDSGVLAELAEPGRELLAGAIAYLLDHNGEAGHACPVACTAGAIKLLQQVGSVDQRQRYLPALVDPDYTEAWRAAQFVTEVQGGSDVGANACIARAEETRPGWYRISGEKWFCSVADADLFVVSARLPDGREGTRGLGLFLIPRSVDGSVNGFTLNRLKDKLGTRSMATAEIRFTDALGEAIGPLEHGFRSLVGIVLDTSRVHNAVSACGLMRRALLEAHGYATHRPAFGQPICGYPAVQQILARMRLRAMAAVATTFRILAMSDRLTRAGDDPDLAAARRIDVMLNKYWTAIQATRVARDGIEVLGGNGTIEDFSVLPRLYRDAIVIESWEGSHNTLIAQVLRDFTGRGLHRAWLAELRCTLDADNPARGALLHSRLDAVAKRLDAAAASDGPERRHFRVVVDEMCRLLDLAGLDAQAAWETGAGHNGGAAAAAELYQLLEIDRVDPITTARVGELEEELAATV